MIPLSLQEQRVAAWAVRVLRWLEDVPYPHTASAGGDGTASGEGAEGAVVLTLDEADPEIILSYQEARKRLTEAGPIICDISEDTIEALMDVGIMLCDRAADVDKPTPTGYAPSLLASLRRAEEFFGYLEGLVRGCKDLQTRVCTALGAKGEQGGDKDKRREKVKEEGRKEVKGGKGEEG